MYWYIIGIEEKNLCAQSLELAISRAEALEVEVGTSMNPPDTVDGWENVILKRLP